MKLIKKYSKLKITMLALLSIPLSIVFIKWMAGEPIEDTEQSNQILPMVAIVPTSPSNHLATVNAFSEVKPTHELKLLAEVSGKVVRLNNVFKTGRLLNKGDVLLMIDDTNYRQSLATANKNLAEAKVKWLQEERTHQQALTEWKRSGLKGEPDSKLVLNLPQLNAAKLGLQQSEVAVQQAQRDLENCQVKAPFDAIVISRKSVPGSYLQIGQEIATLYSSSQIEIRTLLTSQQWSLLNLETQSINLADSKDKEGKTKSKIEPYIKVVDNQNSSRWWSGKILRQERHIEGSSRQRALIVTVDDPLKQGLLTGTFVSLEIPGKQLSNILKLPDSVLSPKGKVWIVDENNRLRAFSAKPIFAKHGFIYIPVVQAKQFFQTNPNVTSKSNLDGLATNKNQSLVNQGISQSLKIVRHPISTYSVGLSVTPYQEKSE